MNLHGTHCERCKTGRLCLIQYDAVSGARLWICNSCNKSVRTGPALSESDAPPRRRGPSYKVERGPA